MRSTALLPPLLAIALAAVSVPASAQQAAPADRCEGTLCDLYYGNSASQPAKPQAATAATPLTVPTGGGILSFFGGGAAQPSATPSAAQPAPRAVVEPGSGGLIAMMKGTASDRCTGTLCDLYYGGPPPDHPEAAVAPAATAAESMGAVEASDAVAARPPREEPQHCVSPANDPWRCYRR